MRAVGNFLGLVGLMQRGLRGKGGDGGGCNSVCWALRVWGRLVLEREGSRAI